MFQYYIGRVKVNWKSTVRNAFRSKRQQQKHPSHLKLSVEQPRCKILNCAVKHHCYQPGKLSVM
ncbi:hypothetical protein J6590_078273 [Homalodisca vitripennis]|nr:hypothetical protein J6590_078273 [Homalodisca vitripennis]